MQWENAHAPSTSCDFGTCFCWRDSQWGAFEYLAFEKIPAYWTTDLSVTLRKSGGGWSLTGYINNAPRTFGVHLSGSF